jgi:hypothetical protein
MRNLVAVPLLGVAAIVQSSIAGQFSLLGGIVDLMLVLVTAWALQERVETGFHWAFLASIFASLVSRLPWFVYFVGYAGVVLFALLLQRRVWQVPMLAMFSLVFLGTVLLHVLTIGYLFLAGASITFAESLGFITLPSVLLNLLVSIPLFAMMRDVAGWVAPGPEAA